MRALAVYRQVLRRSLSSSVRAASDGAESGAARGAGGFVGRLWPLGTWDDPVPIASSSDTRVVGCTGRHGAGVQHPLTWITVEKGKLRECPCCGQVFRLEVRGEE